MDFELTGRRAADRGHASKDDHPFFFALPRPVREQRVLFSLAVPPLPQPFCVYIRQPHKFTANPFHARLLGI